MKQNDVMPDSFFRELDVAEVLEFQQAARDSYVPGTKISGCWHPVYRAECEKINQEESDEIS